MLAAALLALGAITSFAMLAWAHRRFTVDDAFITLRYAANLARGIGPTWNPGDPPAEGYTTFLWMLLLSVPHALGVDAITFAKLAGVAGALACIVASAMLGAEISRGASRPATVAASVSAAIFVALSTSTAVHAVSGMETTAFAALVTLLFVMLIGWTRGARSAFVPALIALALALTRPEGNLVGVVAFASTVVLARSRSRARELGRAALIAWLLPYAAYFLWRFSFYGLVAPLSFYVKATNEPGVFRGTSELVGVFHLFAFAQPILGAGLLLGLALRTRTAAIVLLPVAALFAFFAIPAPIMAYERRYLFPAFPALYAIAAAGIAVAADRVACRVSSRLAPRSALLVVATVSVLSAAHVADLAPGSIAGFTAYGEGLARAHVELGRALRAKTANRKTVALVDVGAVAYVSGWRTIDTFGLNDPYIARSASHAPDYVEAQDPDVVVFLSKRADRLDPHLPWEQSIHDAFVRRGYRPMRSYVFAPDYFLVALERPVAR